MATHRATNLLLTLNLILMKKTQYKGTNFHINSKFQLPNKQ